MSFQKKRKSNINSFPLDSETRSLFLGKTGTGKTTLAIKALERVNTSILFYDPKSDVDSNKFQYIEENSFDELDNLELQKFALQHIKSKSKYVIRGSVLSNLEDSQKRLGKIIIAYLTVLEAIKKRKNGKFDPKAVIFGIDEIDLFAPKGKSECLKEISIISSKGRSVGALLWGISQKAQVIHNNVISQTEQLFLYSINKNDLKNLDNYFEDVFILKYDYDNDPHRFYRSFKNKWSQAMKIKLPPGGKKKK